ncbi:type II toxin-antitoxin system RelE/ParE family toxin [Nitrosomonas sp.]|uniref:type II toxin-antitoxin system RelE/ParE family toxin n=1 Tax=Nitrosomonas sp. TaxID=42353 RepID=UPI0025DC851F|nr:type II toxin-antitoxin system RelE/ParE family toxin [Nitrosomonas sp.]MCC6917407.1 type II toxin-antitoxin system RelE/ParE family toxin [Nitrosomonas sp.]
MQLLVTPVFERAIKKLRPRQKSELDEAVRTIADHPESGEAKVGDLQDIRVYKFRLSNQLCMLAYRVLDESSLKLLAFGQHENFYRDLKRQDK